MPDNAKYINAGTLRLHIPIVGIGSGNASSVDISDNSATSNNGTHSGGEVMSYDAWAQHSVPGMLHIVDDSDTKIGGLTIDSGKALFNAMYSIHLDGASDYVNTNGAFQSLFRTSHTISAWVKIDDGTPANNDTIFGTFNDGDDRILFYIGTGGLLTYLYQAAGTSEYAEEATASFTGNAVTPWVHCVATVQYNSTSSATMRLYVNGVERVLDVAGGDDGTFTGNMGNYTSATTAYIGAEHQESSADEFFKDGKIRDVRLYDYALTPNQVGALFSNDMPSHPTHWWLLDGSAGQGTTQAFEDYGNGTDSDAAGVSLAGWVEGSLKVNGGAVRIMTNGSFT